MDEKVFKCSEQISSFLSFLRECETELDIAAAQEKEADNATQDLLHTLELEDIGYHDNVRVAKAIKNVRRERRIAKDRWLTLCPVVEWMSANKAVIKSLERVLGEVRKAEKKTENRAYTQRAEIVEAQGAEGLCTMCALRKG